MNQTPPAVTTDTSAPLPEAVATSEHGAAVDAKLIDDLDPFDELDEILDDMRSRYDETPQWEFCEGFMAALVCCRRPIAQVEYLDVLLGLPEGTTDLQPGDGSGVTQHIDGVAVDEGVGSFANSAQRERFLQLWNGRWVDVLTALDTPVESLDDATAYLPTVMDVRGAIASLPEAERATLSGDPVPSFGQVWALGFMYAVEAWPEEWAQPSDKKAAKWHDAALQAIVALTEDDDVEPTLSPFSEDGPPSISQARLDAYADAVWSVYDLREIWRAIGPRVQTLRRADVPGRNDPCYCGTGKKYKKCHGA